MEIDHIINKIYNIRGDIVMLDFEIAELYEMETQNLILLVKRTLKNISDDYFMFRLTKTEWQSFQIETSKGRGGKIDRPFAFTPPGLALLRSMLNDTKANKVSNDIMLVFATMKPARLDYFLLEDNEIIELENSEDVLTSSTRYIFISDFPRSKKKMRELIEEEKYGNTNKAALEILSESGQISKNIREAANKICLEIYRKSLTREELKAKEHLLISSFIPMILECRNILIRNSKQYIHAGLNEDRKTYNKSREILINDWWTPEYVKRLLIKMKPKRTQKKSGFTAELAEVVIHSFLLLTKEKAKGGFGLNKDKSRKLIIKLLIKMFPQNGQLSAYDADDPKNKDQSLKKAIQKIEPLPPL